jgi:hypothetical protein
MGEKSKLKVAEKDRRVSIQTLSDAGSELKTIKYGNPLAGC